jgi:hypothetical protein
MNKTRIILKLREAGARKVRSFRPQMRRLGVACPKTSASQTEELRLGLKNGMKPLRLVGQNRIQST